MQLTRGLVFGLVSLLPAFMAAALSWFILGGTSGDDWEKLDDWPLLPNSGINCGWFTIPRTSG